MEQRRQDTVTKLPFADKAHLQKYALYKNKAFTPHK